MGSLVRLKQDIQFNARLGTLLEALKSIAAQQFQALERAFRSHEALFEALGVLIGACRLDNISHPFTRGEGPVGVIVVTSDTGLLGGLNQQVVATALQEYRRNPGEFIIVGDRGAMYVRERGFACKAFPGVVDSGRRALAAQVRDYALNRALEGRLGALTIVYPRALSFTLQRVELVRALPCGEWYEPMRARVPVPSSPVLLESSPRAMIEYLVWLWLTQKLYEVFGMSRLAELAARSVHLEGSAQELQRRGNQLQRRYFRERREVIDRNMRELFAARATYGHN